MGTAHAVWLGLVALVSLTMSFGTYRCRRRMRTYFNLLDAACQASSLTTCILGALSLSQLRTGLRWYDVYRIIDNWVWVVLVVRKVLVGRWATGNYWGKGHSFKKGVHWLRHRPQEVEIADRQKKGISGFWTCRDYKGKHALNKNDFRANAAGTQSIEHQI